MRDVLHRPDKVAAALAGDLSGDGDLERDLEARGWNTGVEWDGKVHFLPDTQGTSNDAQAPAASPPPLASPFRPGPALNSESLLTGRETIVQELLALIENRSPTLLVGPRRSGKTSILYHLTGLLQPRYVVRMISLEGTAVRTLDDFVRLLEPDLADPALADPKLARPAPGPRPKKSRAPRRLSPSAQLLERTKTARYAFLIDEAANLHLADFALLAWLRALGQHAGLVITASEWDWTLVLNRAAAMPGSSFGNDLTPVRVGPLAFDEAVRFLVGSAPPDAPIAEDVARFIVNACGGWPFYLQVMGHAVVQQTRAGHKKPPLTEDDVRALIDLRLFEDRRVVFESRFYELPERVRAILREHRSEPERPAFRALSPEDRKLLMSCGVCNAAGVWLHDPPFFEWLRLYGEIDKANLKEGTRRG
jgi:hypothetical protein